MFVNLFIGDAGEFLHLVDDNTLFSFESLLNGKMILKNNLNNRFLTFQRFPDSFEILPLQQHASRFYNFYLDDPVGAISIAGSEGMHEVITHDFINLNPRLTHEINHEREMEPYLIFVNIDTSLFIPLIYDFPEDAVIKDSYHYTKDNKKYYGFIAEVHVHLGEEIPLRIYGYDKRIKSEHEMESYCIFEIVPTLKTTNDQSTMTVDYRVREFDTRLKSTFFKARTMYKKNKRPRNININGPLYTTHFIGDLNPKDAEKLILNAKIKNDIPVKTKYVYHYIQKDKYSDEESLHRKGILPILYDLERKKVRAFSVLGDVKISLDDMRRTKVQQVLIVDENGKISSILSNR